MVRRNTRLALLLLGIAISSVGDPLTTVASLVSIFVATGSPVAVAATYVLQAIATIAVSIGLGGLADRIKRRRLILSLDLTRGVLLCATPLLLSMSVWSIFPVLFILAAINTLVQPSRQAAIPEVVEMRLVGRANAMSAGVMMIGAALGFPVAGLVIAVTRSTHALFVLDGFTFIAAGLLILSTGAIGGGFHRVGLTSAFKNTWSIRGTHSHLVAMSVAVFFLSMSMPTLITLAYRLSSNGAQAYTWLEAALAIGVVTGSYLVSRMRQIGSMQTVAVGVLVTGVLSLGVAASNWLWLTATFLLGASIGNAVYAIGNSTALLQLSDSANRGSVMATRFAVAQTLTIAGAGAGGTIAAVIGPQATYGALGCGLTILGLAVLVRRQTRQEASRLLASPPDPAGIASKEAAVANPFVPR
jgi:MFS family permease